MHPTRPVRASAIVGLAAGLAIALALAGCGPTGSDRDVAPINDQPAFPVFVVDPDVPVIDDVRYGTAPTGEPLLLDVCLPPAELAPDANADPGADPTEGDPITQPDATLRPAIVMVHGGSWTRGDKADVAWRSTCQWLAKAGYPTFNIDYRLAPVHPFPAAIEDVETAVEWMRDSEQVERFEIDPERIGAFGGSAGGNLVSLLGTRGSGATDTGTRVAAVVELSGPVDLTGRDVTSDFIPVQLAYLGCASQEDCPQAAEASAGTFVDTTDPPFFVAHSSDERIPIAQSSVFVRTLRNAGVSVTFVEMPGVFHSIAMLDDGLRARILQFLNVELVDRAPRPVG